MQNSNLVRETGKTTNMANKEKKYIAKAILLMLAAAMLLASCAKQTEAPSDPSQEQTSDTSQAQTTVDKVTDTTTAVDETMESVIDDPSANDTKKPKTDAEYQSALQSMMSYVKSYENGVLTLSSYADVRKHERCGLSTLLGYAATTDYEDFREMPLTKIAVDEVVIEVDKPKQIITTVWYGTNQLTVNRPICDISLYSLGSNGIIFDMNPYGSDNYDVYYITSTQSGMLDVPPDSEIRFGENDTVICQQYSSKYDTYFHRDSVTIPVIYLGCDDSEVVTRESQLSVDDKGNVVFGTWETLSFAEMFERDAAHFKVYQYFSTQALSLMKKIACTEYAVAPLCEKNTAPLPSQTAAYDSEQAIKRHLCSFSGVTDFRDGVVYTSMSQINGFNRLYQAITGSEAIRSQVKEIQIGKYVVTFQNDEVVVHVYGQEVPFTDGYFSTFTFNSTTEVIRNGGTFYFVTESGVTVKNIGELYPQGCDIYRENSEAYLVEYLTYRNNIVYCGGMDYPNLMENYDTAAELETDIPFLKIHKMMLDAQGNLLFTDERTVMVSELLDFDRIAVSN